jgi:hypothetical protein
MFPRQHPPLRSRPHMLPARTPQTAGHGRRFVPPRFHPQHERRRVRAVPIAGGGGGPLGHGRRHRDHPRASFRLRRRQQFRHVPHAQLILPCARSSLSRLRSRRMCSRRWRVIAPFQYRLTPPRVRGVSGSAEHEPFRTRRRPLRDTQEAGPTVESVRLKLFASSATARRCVAGCRPGSKGRASKAYPHSKYRAR